MNKFIHFSIDDANLWLEDILKNNYDSIFDNPMLSYLKDLHTKENIVVSLYCFNSTSTFNLEDFPTKYKPEFIKNSNWLRFGIHSNSNNHSFEIEDSQIVYEKMYETFSNIFGKESIDLIPRPHYFAMNKKIIENLQAKNMLKGLLSPDDDRNCYSLEFDEKMQLINCNYLKKNNFHYLHTQKRFEYCSNLDEVLQPFNNNYSYNHLIFFTHEQYIDQTKIKVAIESIIKMAKEKKYIWKFPMDIL